MSLKNLIHHFPHFLITLISCENDVYKSEIVADFLGELFSLRRSIMSTSGNMFSNIFQLIASFDVRHEKTDLKAFVVVIPKEGWASVAVPILLLV